MIRRRSPLRFLVILLALAAVQPAGAADTYLVEVLVFENAGEAPGGEHFPAGEHAPPEIPAPPSVRYTGPGLSALAATLGKNPNYRVLLSAGWRQTLADRAAAPAVPVSAPGNPRAIAGIGGTLRLYETTLLFVEADLSYTPATGPAAYRLREKRRVKLNELHYFDHPHFGALVRVSRVPQG